MTKATNVGNGNIGKIKCKKCPKVFNNHLEYLQNKECENPDCQCINVKEAMRQTEELLEKVRQPKVILHPKVCDLPDDCSDTSIERRLVNVDQALYCTVVPKKDFRKPSRKRGKQ